MPGFKSQDLHLEGGRKEGKFACLIPQRIVNVDNTEINGFNNLCPFQASSHDPCFVQ